MDWTTFITAMSSRPARIPPLASGSPSDEMADRRRCASTPWSTRFANPACCSFLLAALVAAADNTVAQDSPAGRAEIATGQKQAPVDFQIDAADASRSLEVFTAQSGTAVVYVVDHVRGVRTNGVRGRFRPREALERLVAHTALIVVEDGVTGTLMIKRTAASNPIP